MGMLKKPASVKAQRNTKPVGIAYLIGRVDHVFKRQMREQLKDLGLTVSQYTALSFLADQQSMSNARLAELAMISPQSAHEMVLSMEVKGWITREPDEADNRVVQIGLSTAGRELLNLGDARVRSIEENMLQGLNGDHLSVLRQTLRLFLENVKADRK